MLVETYECETMPTADLSDEAMKLIEQLGATKQEAYYKEGKPTAPYRLMTKEEFAVYKMLLPERDEISKYDAGPIPLRVLQVGAHAKEVLEVGTLVIWHQGVGKDDPLLTLRIGEHYNGKYYLLARWGEVLEEFNVLFEKAAKLYVEKVKGVLATCKQEVETWSATADARIRKALREGKTDEPNCYWHV